MNEVRHTGAVIRLEITADNHKAVILTNHGSDYESSHPILGCGLVRTGESDDTSLNSWNTVDALGASKTQSKSPLPSGVPLSTAGLGKISQAPVTAMDYQTAVKIISARNLGFEFKNGLKNFVAADSLVRRDFTLEITEFQARAIFVARTIGSAKLTNRISTDTSYKVSGYPTSVHEWWKMANEKQKLLALTISKKFGKGGSISTKKLSMIECPFGAADLEDDLLQESAEDW